MRISYLFWLIVYCLKYPVFTSLCSMLTFDIRAKLSNHSACIKRVIQNCQKLTLPPYLCQISQHLLARIGKLTYIGGIFLPKVTLESPTSIIDNAYNSS